MAEVMIEFRKVVMPDEIEALCEFDRKAFHAYPADLYRPEAWLKLEPYWMILDGKIVGCSAFRSNQDFDGSPRPGTLCISTTGVMPECQGQGLGKLQKRWQIEHAKSKGFTRIVTCMRQSNERIVRLNKNLGFKVLMTDPHYYTGPDEAALVMELDLQAKPVAALSDTETKR